VAPQEFILLGSAKRRDEMDEVTPPWEAYPHYARRTIGWRMGSGEEYFRNWREFLRRLPNDYETRLKYLNRHRPAPVSWSDWVLSILRPDAPFGCTEIQARELFQQGLIEHDAAYHTW
jgi:hypothetical protein